MSYNGLLDVIAKLQVSPPFRAQLQTNAGEALATAELTPHERAQLLQLSAETLARVDAMSIFHRWMRVQEHLTWLDPYRRSHLRPLFEAYLEQCPPCLLNREDALSFCQFGEAQGSDPVLRELCQFERLRLEVAWRLRPCSPPLEVCFGYSMMGLTTWLEGNPEGWPPVSPYPVCITFIKVPMLPAVQVREQAQLERTP